jgi:hypothetical protein
MFDPKQLDLTKEGSEAILEYQDDDVYKKGSDIPFKTLKEVADYNSNYVKEATDFSVKEAEKILEKNKEIDTVSVKIPYSASARGYVNTLVEREKIVRIPGKEGGEKHKSAVKVIVKNPFESVSKPHLKELEEALTKKFVK